MTESWITRHPDWYVQERTLLEQHYPALRVDEHQLRQGRLCLYGDLFVRAPGGTKRFPVAMLYPEATPYERPSVVPLKAQAPERPRRCGTRPGKGGRAHDHSGSHRRDGRQGALEVAGRQDARQNAVRGCIERNRGQGKGRAIQEDRPRAVRRGRRAAKVTGPVRFRFSTPGVLLGVSPVGSRCLFKGRTRIYGGQEATNLMGNIAPPSANEYAARDSTRDCSTFNPAMIITGQRVR